MESQVASIFSVLTLLLFIVVHAKTSDAASDKISDTMLVGASLTGTQTRISTNGIFQFGFFNLVDTDKWYMGIWKAQVPQQTIVWVANRDYPLQNSSAVLNLTENGALVLSYASSDIWSANGASEKAFSAVMSDTGNLVITSGYNNSEFIWQSFDYPGDVWLPGMKITQTRKLTSWKSRWDPSPGIFSFQMDPSGASQVVLMWNTSIEYWQSGIWDERMLTLGPMMTQTQNLKYSLRIFTNGRSKYVTFSVSPLLTYLSSFVMRLDTSGEMRIYFLQENTKKLNLFWTQPVKQCDVYAVCGAYGLCNQNNVQSCTCLHGFRPKNLHAWEYQQWSGGCVRQTPLACYADGFLGLTGSSNPPGSVTFIEHSSMEDCKKACLINCSCTAYAYVNGNCQMWFGELLNLYNDTATGMTLFVRMAASDVPKFSSKNKRAILAASITGGVGGFAVVVIFVFLLHRKSVIKPADFSALSSLTVFSYRELKIATNDFSERLGGGGFGSVFKGTLADKSLVAVKKLERSGHGQGEKQFRTEVSTVGIIQHVNLVRLRGFCSEGSNRMLVYEYMPNGSLNRFLFPNRGEGEEKELKVLDWKTRFQIALGTARGIHYLHEKCIDCIIHCDIKPENILLDSDFCPKLADFGLAKGVGRDFSHVLTTTRGTRGYLAPEWISGLPITTKADVYSFGMTLVEIIAGRRNMDADPEWTELFFPSWAATQIKRGNAMALLDKRLKSNDVDVEGVRRAAMVGGWCIQEEEDARPSMSEVVQMLEGTLHIPLPPIPISLQPRPSPSNTALAVRSCMEEVIVHRG